MMAQPARVINMDDHRNDGPQLEDGFLRIANELFDAILKFPFTLKQQSVLLAIVRKTYGYGKKTDDISASQIGELCGIARNHVTETLHQLAGLGVITLERGEYGMRVGINKHYKQWKAETKSATSPKSGLVPNQDTSPESGLALVPNQDRSIVPNQDIQQTTFQQPISTTNLNNLPAAVSAAADATAAKPKRSSKAKQDDAADTVLQAACRETWGAYCAAYAARYGVDPVRNPTVNSQVKNFVKRLGGEESPQVAAWFVGHPGRFYVQNMHSLGVMLKDAEKLRTEWVTGRIVSDSTSAQRPMTRDEGRAVAASTRLSDFRAAVAAQQGANDERTIEAPAVAGLLG